MFDICHPSYYYISQLGCTDHRKVTLAFHVYIELCEIKRYWDVSYKYNEDLDLLYLEARSSKSSQLEVYVPWSTLTTVTLHQIDNIQRALEVNRFSFVFKDGDSGSVYYTVSAGLVKPASPETCKKLKQKEDKKAELEKQIRRNSSHLYEMAMSLSEDKTKIDVPRNVDFKTEEGTLTITEKKSEPTTSEIRAETVTEIKTETITTAKEPLCL
ncbi:uncharacterized protein LOC105702225 [Orussus abietinus]|uniref:uncharacterized protein LOC105702225 n=1 Tax=Orussus abietinus TaxID=222816 RepID=UPI0006262395|nr:uncharacterized protein LOC105702225 [Orussus abietinus]